MTVQRTAGERSQPLSAAEFASTTNAIVENIEKVIEGKTATIRLALAVMLAEGHLLIEDVPGVGKTKLAKALARSIDCTVRRIQFTPRPAALRCDRGQRLQPGGARLRVQGGRDLRQHRGG